MEATRSAQVGVGVRGAGRARDGVQRLPRSTPEEQGVDPRALSATLDALLRQPELHSLMVLRHGHVVAEGWAAPFGPERPHQLFSLSKSFTSTAVGLAVADGLLTVDDRVVDVLGVPERSAGHLDDLRVRHLLTMTTGHDIDPSGAVFSSRDWVHAFLDQPISHQPGTHFVYNTAATYVLSAIVQRLTGQRVLSWLRPRLLVPLGITGATWERSPQGIDTGGFGLSLRTEDVAAFGQLYLQDGVWQRRRLLPEGWVAEATRFQVPNGDPVTGGDWWQGYGYQFWRCRHGAYRGDGAFGQYCVVLPEQDAVVVMTSGLAEMQAPLDALWEHLLPGLHDEPLAADPDGRAALEARLGALRLDPPAGVATSSAGDLLSGRTIAFSANSLGVAEAVLRAGADEDRVVVRAGRRTWDLRAGHHAPIAQSVRLRSRAPSDALVSAVWTSPETYVLTVRYPQTPFVWTVRVDVSGDRVTVRPSVNVSFGPTEMPVLTGTVTAAVAAGD